MKDIDKAYKRWAKERSDEARKNWYRAVKYYNERNNDPKLQGWYNADGKLLLGWICK
jgi:hypothetical protein